MSGTYEKGGIIYLQEPCRTNLWKWQEEHLGVDTLIKECNADFANDIITVYAYASSMDYNDALYQLALASDGLEVLQGLYEKGVYSVV